MNGISLLLLLSSLGVTHGVETGANGQPIFAIHIESILVGQLRDGEAVSVTVPDRDRTLRRFKIAITPESGGRATAATREFNSRTGDLFNYEPVRAQTGEIEYWVQISPERLQSLAAGSPIEGEIANEIPAVDRFWIFVGMNQLPSQQPNGAGNVASNVPSLLGNGESSLIPATANDPGRLGSPPLTKTQYQAPQQPAPQPPAQNPRYADPVTQYGNRITDSRTGWRNTPDQSTVAPPPQFTSNMQPSATIGGTGRGTAAPTTGAGGYAANPNYGPTTQPNYNNQPNYNTQPQYNQPQYSDPNQGYAQQPAGFAQPGYQQVAARPEAPAVSPSNVAAAGLTQTAAAQPVVTQAAVVPAVQPVAQPAVQAAAKATDPERPWTPLILTTLALFASLGANAYLGWLAWSFFWRFRDAVTESARARSHHSPSRQAA